ncbi:hemerythrin domain-containing protein [Nocardioides sp. zg-1228]|uniref:hemerythrin domain-containing protein n=1 Tax=Nocardioides sp. zg-1228 TaxID=2763008 RepID=UPI001642C441|nr:hemerythrin domain-containing protein [Nocardioides sp. zg-1228]MBC2933560.1 hemerythrin domain-containing protein [Nocardioides sp. zg-1228]QSF56312.1 hemerythrin domain-containing protein [Nocardioides sp. zg-1228]
MTEQLSMNQIIHAAVRRDVSRTEQALRELREGDAARAAQIRTAWRNLQRELTHHHEAEDEHVWPFLESRGFDLTLLEEMEAEHVAMKQALAAVSTSLDAVVAAPTAVNATAAADEVARAREVINGHLDHEERDVEGPMGALHDDPEFRELTKKLRPASAVDAANALAWMQDGAGERELSSLRAAIPGPVVTVMTRVVARRYRREVAPVWR